MLSEDLHLAISLVSENDDGASFEKIFKHFYPGLLSFSESFLKNRFLAEEVVEDVFIKLWTNRKVLPAIKNLTYYLYVATKHETINCLKKNKKHFNLSIDEIEAEPLHFKKTPESILISEEILKEIEGAIIALPPRCQLIFRLVKEEGLKYKETAELLSISVKTVETQMTLALSKIMEFLKERMTQLGLETFQFIQKSKQVATFKEEN